MIDLPRVAKGKVRDLYDLGESTLLVVASDRVSVFDVVLGDEIPDKGRVLTGLATFWFEHTSDLVPNHYVSSDPAEFPDQPEVAGRAMVVRAARPIRLECVARGYLFGGAWEEYRRSGRVQGRLLPSGMWEAEPLPEALFTPTTKAEAGHDVPLSDADAAALVGADTFEQVRDLTLAVYRAGAEHAASAGILLADTKLEFGHVDDELVVIDELLTPDSSRYWPADEYVPGGSPPSFDKQFVRDHYLGTDWNREPPAPRLPSEVIAGTRARYVEAYERITGQPFATWWGP